MTFVIAAPCAGCKHTDCVEVCPVDCIYDAGDQLVIHPDECIDCALCEPECPTEAIYSEDELPDEWASYLELNYQKAETSPNITQMQDALSYEGRCG